MKKTEMFKKAFDINYHKEQIYLRRKNQIQKDDINTLKSKLNILESKISKKKMNLTFVVIGLVVTTLVTFFSDIGKFFSQMILSYHNISNIKDTTLTNQEKFTGMLAITIFVVIIFVMIISFVSLYISSIANNELEIKIIKEVIEEKTEK